MWQESGVQLGAADTPAPLNGCAQYNKFGGKPDWPTTLDVNFNTRCKVCQYPRPLLLQCYAPLESSPFHRTLYVFACINPNCWNNSDSWSCIRVQYRDDGKNDANSEAAIGAQQEAWCDDADAWCDDDNIWGDEDLLNGNANVSRIEYDNKLPLDKNEQDMEDIITATESMKCNDVNSRLSEMQKICESNVGATAEIEIDESQQISIDAPMIPQCDLKAIINNKPEIPDELKKDGECALSFDCVYIKAYPEYLSSDSDRHVEELLQKYQQENENVPSQQQNPFKSKSKKKSSDGFNDEEYEKGVPLHGDMIFHSFLNRIKMNPEQIIRYQLGGEGLLLSQLPFNLKSIKCKHCSGDTWFELQILPTMIPLLKLHKSKETHLEYGNVIIYTCKNSCWKANDSFVHETVIVQKEP